VALVSPPNHEPSARATEPVTELLSQLVQLDDALGHAVPKQRMSGGAVGIELPPEQLLEGARVLRDRIGFDMLTCVSGVDMVDHIESVYHFRSISRNWLLQIRVKLAAGAPEVDSLVSLYPSANWLERESYDMVGITYRGHPDLRRILLDDDFNGFPLLKSFHPTPITVKDRATTQVDGPRAVAGEQQRNVERIVAKNLGQGDQERLHPGKLTFGSAAVYVQTGQGVEGPETPSHGYSAADPAREGPIVRPEKG
jgi:NADH/F420H2 dehydrogenase subunit C